jgi:hypothetical protein
MERRWGWEGGGGREEEGEAPRGAVHRHDDSRAGGVLLRPRRRAERPPRGRGSRSRGGHLHAGRSGRVERRGAGRDQFLRRRRESVHCIYFLRSFHTYLQPAVLLSITKSTDFLKRKPPDSLRLSLPPSLPPSLLPRQRGRRRSVGRTRGSCRSWPRRRTWTRCSGCSAS